MFYHEADTSISPQKREAIESEVQRCVRPVRISLQIDMSDESAVYLYHSHRMLEEGQNRARKLLKEKEVELHRVSLSQLFDS